jgi:hypothetical protein
VGRVGAPVSGGKILVASLPNLQEGSVVEYEIHKTPEGLPALCHLLVLPGGGPGGAKEAGDQVSEVHALKTVKADNGLAADPSWKPFPPD